MKRMTPYQVLRLGGTAGEVLGARMEEVSSEYAQQVISNGVRSRIFREGVERAFFLALNEKALQAFDEPWDLKINLESQARFWLGLSKSTSLSEKNATEQRLLQAIEAFEWSPKLAALGFDQVALIDYDRPIKEWADSLGTNEKGYHLSTDYLRMKVLGEEPTEGARVIQFQCGQKYTGKSVEWCDSHYEDFELPLTAREGFAIAKIRPVLSSLTECRAILAGSRYNCGGTYLANHNIVAIRSRRIWPLSKV